MFDVDNLSHLSREALEAEVLRWRRYGNAAGNAGSEAVWQRAMFRSALDFAMIITDRAGMVTDWNLGAERMLGWAATQMIGQPAELFFTPEDRANGRVAEEMREALRDGKAADERWHVRKSGQRFWASGQMSPLFGDEGEHLGYLKILRDRTEEHLQGEALKDTQERYRLAAKATTDAVWDWDLLTQHVLWNDALREAYGYAPEDVQPTGHWWLAHIHPDDRSRIDASIHAVIDSRDTAWADEYRFLRADGTHAQVLDRGHVIRDADGKALRMIGAMLDVSQMHAAREALRESEERFRTILGTIEAAFAIVEVKFDERDEPVDYRFLEVNPAFERQSGVDLKGKWVTEFAPDLEQFWFQTYGRVAKTGEPANFESYAAAFSRWFDVRAVKVGSPQQRQIAILFNDVTERRTAQERLRISEALARQNIERVQLALAAGAIVGTWHWDLLTDEVTVDDAFAEVFGLDPVLGQGGLRQEQLLRRVHPDDRPGLEAALAGVIQGGATFSHQYRVSRPGGAYAWIEANGRVNRADDGTAISLPGVLIDLEERRSVEAERDRATAALRALNETLELRVEQRTTALMQAEEKLRQSQKMEAVGQLTGGLAHDFNNLLAGISGALELMSTRISQGRLNDLGKYMAAAQGAARRAAALTHRLLAFSRRQTLDPRPTDVNGLIDGMVELIQRTVGPSIRVEMQGESSLWPAMVDPSQLENGLLNLCINARDAMPDGGRITIATGNHTFDQATASGQDLQPGDYLSLCVTDTGTGMTPDVVANAFDPFFTTKPIGQGTGLGLSMIYGFAKQSGGQVRIDSKLGEGTTICIHLPRYRGSAHQEAGVSQESATPVPAGGETLLIVEDDATVRMLLKDALGDLGYNLIEAADSVAGLNVLRSEAAVHLLITDVGLPGGMNGRQMAEAGLELRPELKVLFITGYAENAAFGHHYLGPGMQVLSKPFVIDSLLSRVQALLAERG